MRIERLDAVTALEVTEHPVCCVVTLLHRGERVHTTQCAPHLLAKVIEDHRVVYGNEEELK